MTKTLQKRFVITAMAAISVLLLVLVGTINIANYWIASQQIEEILLELVESEGLYTPPIAQQKEERPPFPSAPTPDDMMGARYFFVRFDSNGQIIQVDVDHILSVSEDEAKTLAAGLFGSIRENGNIENFKYKITHARDQMSSLIIFLDISSQQRSMLTVLLASFSVGLLCWGVMLLLVILLSKRAIDPIARNMEKQKQFVTNAGHEIKTPLAIILANTDAMELHNGENKWSRNIRAQAIRLNGLMQNMLILAKMDEGQDALPIVEFSVPLLLEEILDLYSETIAARQLMLQTDIQPDITIRANRDSLMQLISILLDNATKYGPDHGDLSILLKKENRAIILQVKNTCEVKPEEDIDKLFDRFYRGDSARTQKNGGYGIGLSAARAIAEANGGTIVADYDPTEKTIVFSVTL